MKDILPLIIASALSTSIGLIGAAIWGILRKKAVAHVKISSPEARALKRIASSVRRHSFLLQAGADRAGLQARCSIVLANAIKTGDKTQVDKALEIIMASEQQYLASLQTQFISHDKVSDAESVEEGDKAI
jgi:hypothetical protein